MTTQLAEPTAYYSICSTTSPLAQAGKAARRAEYVQWRECLNEVGPLDEDERDWSEHAASLALKIGGTERYIASHLESLETLDRMPGLRALFEEMMHLSMRHLHLMDVTLSTVHPDLRDDEAFWDFLDGELIDYLTPTKSNQILPTPADVSRRIRSIIQLLEENLPAKKLPEEPVASSSNFQQWPQSDGQVLITATHDPETSVAIEKAVRTHALANEISMAAAHAELVLKQVKVTVVLNAYQAADLPEAPVFLSPVGALNAEDSQRVAAAATVFRDMGEIAAAEYDRYSAPPALHGYLEGRDWVCRWPGCNRPGPRTQKDHRIDYEDGGKTSASNMVCLCQHHHNRKTDRAARYLLDPYSGDVYWLFDDHTWAVDEAQGPLAPRQKRWVSTIGQRRERRLPTR